MSQSIKNFKLLKLKYIFSLLFIILNLVFYILSLKNIEFHKTFFTIFIFLSAFNFLICLNSRSFFFEKFFTFYIWIGFAFFYFLHINFFNQQYSFSIGKFDFSNQLHLKELYLVLIVFNIGVLISIFISRKFLLYSYKPLDLKLGGFFAEKPIYFFTLIVLTIFSIFFVNYKFKIFNYYYFYESKHNFFLDSFLKWFFLFGFTSLMCILLNLKYIKQNLLKLFYIVCIQEVLFYFSILSRGCIFNTLAIFFALISKNYKKQNFSFKLVSFSFLFIFILFFLNFLLLIDKRGGDNLKNFQDYRGQSNFLIKNIGNFILVKKNDKNIQSEPSLEFIKINYSQKEMNYLLDPKIYTDLKNKIIRFVFVIKNRIFGIDSLMAIVSYEKKNFSFLKSSLQEKFNPGMTSFFDKIRHQNQMNEISNNVTLPSIITFLYYSGSKLFVFISIILIMVLCNLFERLNILLNNNVYLSALIGQLLAYRLWHFGYAPLNSYKFFLSVLFTILICFLLTKILSKLNILRT